MNRDTRIDLYLENAADFAKPILNHLRALVHEAWPDITETMKWSFPHFDFKGTVCSMAAFKQHCAFGFWKSSLIADPDGLLKKDSLSAMGQFGRITSLADLPPDEVIRAYIKDAVLLNVQGVKVKPAASAPRTELIVPDYLVEALNQHKAALNAFQKFSYSHKKEYIQWFEEAKTEQTRNKRIATALEWLADGKSRNWKYEIK